MSLFRFLSTVGGKFETGDIKTLEEIMKAGCDPVWLVEAKAIEPVEGPTAAIALAIADADELLGEVTNLQGKWEEAQKRADELKARNEFLESENKELKAANESARTDLTRAVEKLKQVNAELRRLKTLSADRIDSPEPVTV